MSKKTYSFEAETERLLELLTHSIYSNKEIFLRELISNASDAIDKARIKSLTDVNYLGENSNFEIKINIDKENKTITIEDNGVGMTRDEVITNLGTIAKSGTKDFLDKLKETKEQNNLIGQFGVGFYSVFMIANKVELETKSNDSDKSIVWISEGKGKFEINEGNKETRGTLIKIYIKDEDLEFIEEWKLKELIKKYSNFINIPILMLETENETNKDNRKYEQVNETKAIWDKQKNELKEEDYEKFYSSISYDFAKPLTYIHLNTEGTISYKSILFVPSKKNMFYNNDDATKDYGPKLFVQNVLILENAKDLLPVWLRFIHGIVSTNDLPLNISREMLQSNNTLEKIKKSLTKKLIEKIAIELKDNTEYDEFLENFGKFLKEGIYYESELREKIAELLKFNTLLNKKITLDKYLEEIPPTKKEDKEIKNIYYVLAKNENEARSNPYIDNFKQKGIDVILLTDPIDEWLIQVLTEYKGNKLLSITNSELEEESKEEIEKIEESKKELKDLLELIKNTIGTDKIESINISNKLGDNLGALKTKEGGLTPQMEKMMKAMGQHIHENKKILELNSNHRIIKMMQDEFNTDIKSEKLKDLILYTYEQAILLEGGELEDYKGFINRVNKFIEK
ncbi:MAG: molecular chaperone HtpG [Candidatus Gracilibacteria bacterium]|nr:molecular chaperone HtpG [Candidatus Gracilibacteria bacterium]